MTAIMRGGDGAGQHMQYIKAERTLKPKASETIKTIITSDKFIARKHTHTHTHTHNISFCPHTHTPLHCCAAKTLCRTDKRDESLSFCGLKSNACNQTTKVATRGELGGMVGVDGGGAQQRPHYCHAGHTTFAALKASSTNANSCPHKYQAADGWREGRGGQCDGLYCL